MFLVLKALYFIQQEIVLCVILILITLYSTF